LQMEVLQMDKNIILTIRGSHRNMDGEDRSIELVTQGRLYKKNDAYYIEYEESELSGMQGTKTQISIKDGTVMMERVGKYPSQLLFEKGKMYINSYETPYGSIQIEVYPTRVDHDLDDNGGKVDLEYQLGIDGRFVSSNELQLFYR